MIVIVVEAVDVVADFVVVVVADEFVVAVVDNFVMVVVVVAVIAVGVDFLLITLSLSLWSLLSLLSVL